MFRYFDSSLRLLNLSFIGLMIFVILQDSKLENGYEENKELQLIHSSTSNTEPTEKRNAEKAPLKFDFVKPEALEKHFQNSSLEKRIEKSSLRDFEVSKPVPGKKFLGKTKKHTPIPNKVVPRLFDVEQSKRNVDKNLKLVTLSHNPKPRRQNRIDLQMVPLSFDKANWNVKDSKKVLLNPLRSMDLSKKQEQKHPLMKEVLQSAELINQSEDVDYAAVEKEESISQNIQKQSHPSEGSIQLAESDIEEMVESGELSITFYWPDSKPERENIYNQLRDCHGMMLGVFDEKMQLFDDKNNRLNQARLSNISPMLRQISTPVSSSEVSIANRLRAKKSGPLVRFFPKRFDAYLIASLRENVASAIEIKGRITAEYSLDNSEVILKNWEINGRRFPGSLELKSLASSCST